MLFKQAFALLLMTTASSLENGSLVAAAKIAEVENGGGQGSVVKDNLLRGTGDLSSNAGEGEVRKHVELSPEGILHQNGAVEKMHILKDDSEATATADVKMMSAAQIKAFEEDVKSFHDRPIEFIPRTEGGTTYGSINLVDKMKRGDYMTSAKTTTFTSPFPRVKSSEGTGQVSCGGHSRPTCEQCPFGQDGVTNHGAGWCNGDCIWNAPEGICQEPDEVPVCNVSCGGHCAEDCAACPQGNGAGWCNGDCEWNTATSTCETPPAKMCNSDGSVTAPTCSECSDEDCTGSSECEKMPPLTENSSPSGCRYVLDNDSRSASTFLNYVTPSTVSQPSWWFDKLDILTAAKSSFFATNGHRFGYAGFQVSDTSPYDGRVVFSIWDQGGCDQDANNNCPEAQVARTVACGSGIYCGDFGGEGTGRKSIVYSDNLPLLDDPYYMVSYAKLVAPYRMQYSSFFYVPGNADWDSSDSENEDFVPTSPGWRFLSTIEVGTDANEQWWMMNLYSFLEQWTGADGLSLREGLYGPSFLAEDDGDFTQITQAYFRHGTIENYAHVSAWNDASGSIGMKMGGDVTREAYNNQLFTFPERSLPEELVSFLPIKECLMNAATTTADIEACL